MTTKAADTVAAWNGVDKRWLRSQLEQGLLPGLHDGSGWICDAETIAAALSSQARGFDSAGGADRSPAVAMRGAYELAKGALAIVKNHASSFTVTRFEAALAEMKRELDEMETAHLEAKR